MRRCISLLGLCVVVFGSDPHREMFHCAKKGDQKKLPKCAIDEIQDSSWTRKLKAASKNSNRSVIPLTFERG